ncbi:hypothetical protein PACTADRAFT_33402 [Pachysolen tannophilus NRRL Y-2460]|uniref:SMP-30/Gluconolactonase/LRE-like region domain-containing protein n=1 Tax=Pachysolen tannophilus NRRL Y-2460 TaxID=669874 RepID=A0A1E4TWX1_PACTA|nr:hypothetical protein PACTADRAFT_33402 [Pachysolen tannophilus NRRL Y-2460]
MSSVKLVKVEVPFISLKGSRLPEGATYNHLNHSFLWVDIIAGEVHRVFLPANDEENVKEMLSTHEVVKVEDSCGVIGLTSDNDIYIVGCQKGVGFVNFKTKEFKYKLFFPSETYNISLRSNDGSIDDKGNFWVGTMDNFDQPSVGPNGFQYRVNHKDFSIDTLIKNCYIPNGMAWKDNKFYWTDSGTYTIWKFDYDSNTGEISNKQPLINMKDFCPEDESPEPDGFAMAANGDIYTAVWSTGKVLRFNLEGKLMEKFIFPAKRVTCPIIGGKNFNELFVTSADLHLDDVDKLASEPGDLGGAIFKVVLDSDVRGLPKNIWGGNVEDLIN